MTIKGSNPLNAELSTCEADMTVGTSREGRCAITFAVERSTPGLSNFKTREEVRLEQSDVEFLHKELGEWLKRRKTERS